MWFGAPFSTHLGITRQKGLADTLKVGQTTVKNTASVGPSSLPGCTEKRKKTRHYVWFSGTSKILENRVARFPVLCCMLELTTHTNPALLDYSHEILKTLTVNLLRTFPRLCTRPMCFTSRALFTIHPLHASVTCGLLGSHSERRSKLFEAWSSNRDRHDCCSTNISKTAQHLKCTNVTLTLNSYAWVWPTFMHLAMISCARLSVITTILRAWWKKCYFDGQYKLAPKKK